MTFFLLRRQGGFVFPALLTVLIFMVVGMAGLNAQDLNKTYAPIIGSYEFDWSDLGMGIITVEFYVEDDVLWALPDTASSPEELLPVEGKTFEFTAEDPQEGTYHLKFMKDKEGKYTKCHVLNEMMGIDSIGVKIE